METSQTFFQSKEASADEENITQNLATFSQGALSPRQPGDSEQDTERANDDEDEIMDEEEDEDGGLDELIIMDEDEQAERENKLAGCEDAAVLKE